MDTTDLAIEGMSCAACVTRVERVLARVPGVTDASVNLATERARITTTEHPDLGALIRAVEKAGYGAKAVEADAPPAPPPDNTPLVHVLIATGLAAPLMLGMAIPGAMLPGWAQFVLATLVQFGLGWRFYVAGWRAALALSGNMDLLVALGTSAAWGLSTWTWLGTGHAHGLYYESSAVLIAFILFGKFLEGRARRQTGAAIRALMRLRPDTARVVRDGVETDTPIDRVRVGDRVAVRPGERIPVDGVVQAGEAGIDAAMLTGESRPVDAAPGTHVAAGAIDLDGHLIVETTAVGAETVLARIVRLVEGAQASKAPIQRLADRVSAVFVPIVLAIAAATLAGWLAAGATPGIALTHAISVLVIACPCALGLATPTALVVGTGAAAKHGILIRDAAALERAHNIQIVAFDKTGTLTEGKPRLTGVTVLRDDRDTLLGLAASLQAGSEHSLAQAVRDAAIGLTLADTADFRAVPGRGVTGSVNGRALAMGNRRLMTDLAIAVDAADDTGTGAWLAETGVAPRLLGFFAFADTPKPNAKAAIAKLRAMGLRTLMLTGDNRAAAASVARAMGLDDFKADILPADKAAAIAALRADGNVVAMVGDGINDAPALAAADIGMAMATGTDVAMETAGITLMRGDPGLVAAAIDISRRTTAKIRQGLFWAFAYNVLGIPLAALGYLSPVLAGAAMALSSVSVVANALLLKSWRP
ncbi:MAG: heavy metal translocating P-type ATPase [Rhodospirillales bacterium]